MDTIWLSIGLCANVVFSSRFLVQWIASERAGRSTVPVTFWFLSVIGAGLLLAYALYRRDPVFILSQAGGILIYLRNLHLIFRKGRPQPAA